MGFEYNKFFSYQIFQNNDNSFYLWVVFAVLEQSYWSHLRLQVIPSKEEGRKYRDIEKYWILQYLNLRVLRCLKLRGEQRAKVVWWADKFWSFLAKSLHSTLMSLPCNVVAEWGLVWLVSLETFWLQPDNKIFQFLQTKLVFILLRTPKSHENQ